MREARGPFWKKFRILLPSDFFIWVLASGCFEGGKSPYLHSPACKKDCGKACNERGRMMGAVIERWKNGDVCTPKKWNPKRRFGVDNI